MRHTTLTFKIIVLNSRKKENIIIKYNLSPPPILLKKKKYSQPKAIPFHNTKAKISLRKLTYSLHVSSVDKNKSAVHKPIRHLTVHVKLRSQEREENEGQGCEIFACRRILTRFLSATTTTKTKRHDISPATFCAFGIAILLIKNMRTEKNPILLS